MELRGRIVRVGWAVLAAGVLLSGCASVNSPKSSGAAPRYAVSAPATSGGSELWQMRVGLNVAALQCRRTRGLTNDYRRTLARHKQLLAATYSAEKRHGGRSFDTQQTRLYNRFANQRSPAHFCSAAAGVAHEASTLNSAQLIPASRVLLARLERGRR